MEIWTLIIIVGVYPIQAPGNYASKEMCAKAFEQIETNKNLLGYTRLGYICVPNAIAIH